MKPKSRDVYHDLCGERVTTRLLYVLSTRRVISILSPELCTPERILVMSPAKIQNTRGCGPKTYQEFLDLQEKLNRKQIAAS